MSRWIVEEPLDVDALVEETRDPECGALVVFLGTVRAENEGRRVERLDYEAQPAMSEKVLQGLEEQVLDRFEVRRCRIQHRVGSLELGEASVAVVVRAPHRAPAFEAARWAMDELKERLPVWKEEHYADGESRHLEGTPLAGSGPSGPDPGS